MYDLLIYGPHVLVGTVVLGLFWRTFASVKGSRGHRRYGRVYMFMLLPLLASVVPISLQRIAEEGPAKLVQLFYLFIVVCAAGWSAWRAVKDKNDPDRFRGPVFRLLGGTLLVLGVILLIVGISTWNVLAVGFSSIGIVFGGSMVGFLARQPDHGWWLDWHLNGVSLLFAATHASFVGLVFRTLRPSWDGDILHALTQLGVIASAFLLRQWLGYRYQRRAYVPALSGETGSTARQLVP